MKKLIFVSVAVPVVAVIGAATYGVYQLVNHDEADVSSRGGSIALNRSEDKSPSAAGESADSLSVKSANDASLGGTPLGGGSSSVNSRGSIAGSNASSGASANSGSNNSTPEQLPGPSGFSVYEQYKSNETALYIEVQPGSGPEVKLNTKVTVNYRGWLSNGKQFDESYARGKPFTFVEGAHGVILGWEQSIFGMKVGGKRRLVIPPGVGYGSQAQGDSIPANSLLIFDVELVAAE